MLPSVTSASKRDLTTVYFDSCSVAITTPTTEVVAAGERNKPIPNSGQWNGSISVLKELISEPLPFIFLWFSFHHLRLLAPLLPSLDFSIPNPDNFH